MTIIRKLKNVSDIEVPIQIDEQTTVYVAPNQTMENINIYNLDNVRQYLKVEQDLGEVNPIKESRTKLYD